MNREFTSGRRRGGPAPPRSDADRQPEPGVAAHYDRWPFPGVEHGSREGLILLRSLAEWLGQPQRRKADTRVLDVGCGTGHTIVALARHFPETAFLGVDVAASALEAAGAHASEAGVSNVTFRCADVSEEPDACLGRFDVVLCLGVLHHIPKFGEAFRHVTSVVADGGFLVLWLYGRHGRARHALNQDFLRTLAPEPSDAERLDLARAFLEDLGPRFAVDTGFYTPLGCDQDGIAWLLEQPQWLADQMIPAFERSVTLPDILDAFRTHSLELVKWLGVSTDLARYTSRVELLEQFRRLSRAEQLVAIDLLVKPRYYFVAGQRIPARE